ncbi:hypothetical protein RXV86_21425 [Alisedimentitalea sp. MJ-SS2]|uniref:hypothetical protein n=1 Tax=Aliisedimentitalea sp. MJ-SS2 TaxID=3049795 RepID=UPI0029087EC5|nr:hypothetical protein [Alisedimentitalea sp. MJ-SS2]MDU8929956.1 hypothetical protein [Alisedimentitalea sp. MJ-SS2]
MLQQSTRQLLTTVATLGLMAGTATAQTVLTTNSGIIEPSLCVGIDCAPGMTFGFDTVRLKENNLRIHFDDTSNSASFPSSDWRITINDSSNGGANRFSIDNATNSRTPFTIRSGAATNALYVDDQGDVGLGTSTPALELSIADGDTPSIRLEQNGSSGWNPQTWDVAGNETNFFIRDATNGSTLPFRIRPGAPTDSIRIDPNGNVGIGDSSPDASLNVQRSDGTAQILVEETNATVNGRTLLHLRNNGPAFLRLDNTALGAAERWIFSHDSSGRLGINNNGGTNEFLMDGSGNITITGTLITTGGGGACTAADPCDAVFDPSVYTVPSIKEHAAEMWTKGHLPAVGPIGADQPVDMTKTMLRMLNELEHAHIYIDQQDDQIALMQDEMARINAELAELRSQIDQNKSD